MHRLGFLRKLKPKEKSHVMKWLQDMHIMNMVWSISSIFKKCKSIGFKVDSIIVASIMVLCATLITLK